MNKITKWKMDKNKSILTTNTIRENSYTGSTNHGRKQIYTNVCQLKYVVNGIM